MLMTTAATNDRRRRGRGLPSMAIKLSGLQQIVRTTGNKYKCKHDDGTAAGWWIVLAVIGHCK